MFSFIKPHRLVYIFEAKPEASEAQKPKVEAGMEFNLDKPEKESRDMTDKTVEAGRISARESAKNVREVFGEVPDAKKMDALAKKDPTAFFEYANLVRDKAEYSPSVEIAAKNAAKEKPGLVFANSGLIEGQPYYNDVMNTAFQTAVDKDPRLVISYINLCPDGPNKQKLLAQAQKKDPAGAKRYAV